MKRFLIVALASMMVLGLALTAGATEFRASGQMLIEFEGSDNLDFQDIEERDEEDFDVVQRLRLQLEFIASENLRGVWALEVGWSSWGSDGFNASNAVDIETRHLFLEFNVPQTDLLLRLGDMAWATPSNFGTVVLDVNATGILAVYPIMEEVSLAAFWVRMASTSAPINGRNNSDVEESQFNAPVTGNGGVMGAGDDVDAFGAILAINFDGIGSLTPYFIVANVGSGWILEDSNYGQDTGYDGNYANEYTDYDLVADGVTLAGLTAAQRRDLRDTDATAWWIGIVTQLTYFDPFVLDAEFHYGKVDTEVEAADRYGWLMAFRASYALDFMTPQIAFWYGSGLDDDAGDGDERLPTLGGSFNGTMFGFDGSWMNNGLDNILNDPNSGAGTWGMAFTLADISFVEDLTHQLQFAFAGGTNDEDAVDGSQLMGANDWLFEITFANRYMIYENLAAVAEFGWASKYFDEDDHSGTTDNLTDAWKFGFGLNYSF